MRKVGEMLVKNTCSILLGSMLVSIFVQLLFQCLLPIYWGCSRKEHSDRMFCIVFFGRWCAQDSRHMQLAIDGQRCGGSNHHRHVRRNTTVVVSSRVSERVFDFCCCCCCCCFWWFVDRCVFDVLPNGAGLSLIEKANEYTVDDIRAATGCTFAVSDGLKSMEE